MNLAKLIHQALTNPQFRLALETGTLSLEEAQLSPRELSAAAEVLRDSPHFLANTSGDVFGKLFNTVCVWGGDGK